MFPFCRKASSFPRALDCLQGDLSSCRWPADGLSADYEDCGKLSGKPRRGTRSGAPLQSQIALNRFPGNGPFSFDFFEGFQCGKEVLSIFVCVEAVEFPLQFGIFQNMRCETIFCRCHVRVPLGSVESHSIKTDT